MDVANKEELLQLQARKVDNSRRDLHINELPEDILSLILSFLTMREAAKARLLASGWRYLSSSTSNLRFDPLTIFGIDYDDYYLHKTSGNLWEGNCRFVRAVDQFLLLWISRKINSFGVCYCLGNESACHIDRWISCAVGMQTEKLDLNFGYVPEGCELYNFPCQLLPQGETSHLKHLCLEGCYLKPTPEFTNRFNSLKILNLNRMPLDQDDFDCTLFGCINLERLTLTKCSLPVTLTICGKFISLKLLLLYHCHGAKKIEINRINLNRFEYIGAFDKFMADDLSFVDVPSVEKVHINLNEPSTRLINYTFHGLAKDLPCLQSLSIAFFTNEVPQIPGSWSKFSNLKELELIINASSSLDFDVPSLSLLLNAYPCLRKLHVYLQGGSHKRRMVPFERVNYPEVYYQLKEVEISGGSDGCLDLALYLLSTAIGLERMIINMKRRWYNGASRWTYHKGPPVKEYLKKRLHSGLLEANYVNPNLNLIVL